MRNVGFVKVEQDDKETIVHIHGKGLRLSGDKCLKLYIFFKDGNECTGIWQGTIENVNPAVNYRLCYTAEDTGIPENYPLIEGIIMENDNQRKFAAVWNDMPADLMNMKIWKEERAASEDPEAEKRSEAGEKPEAEECEPEEEAIPCAEEPERDPEAEGPVPVPGCAEEVIEAPSRDEPAENEPAERAGMDMDMQDRYIKPTWPQYTKIQRQDIARLPRCEWRLANNSFLLHGYYNYHHLLFIEDGDESWLGVPGIYHQREAKAAEAFGFPRFIRVDEDALGLTQDERNTQDDFGYWCRQVRR